MSVRFDDSADYLTYSGTLPDPTTASTTSGWAYIVVDRDSFTTFWRLHLNAGSGRGQLGTDVSGTAVVHYAAGALSTEYNLAVGAWSRLAVVTSGGTRTIYLAPASGAVLSFTGSTSGMAAPEAITLGAVAPGNTSEPLNGRLSHIRMWSVALTQTQLEAEWASATPVITAGLWADWPLTGADDITDHSGNGRDLTAGGTLTTEDEPTFGEVEPPTGAASGRMFLAYP